MRPHRSCLRSSVSPEASARAVLGEDAFEHAYAEGRAMSLNEARAYAIELSEIKA